MPSRLRALLLLVPLLLAVLFACSDPGTGSSTGVAADGTALTVADGYVPDGAAVSPFADVPAITELEPGLRAALQESARAAAADGIDLYVTSGWRSPAYQQALFDAAVAEHGSVEAARAYVLRPEESEHVTGQAVDIGPPAAMSWMQQHGSEFGLCQTYGNEPWHYELGTTPGTACPPPLTDARAG